MELCVTTYAIIYRKMFVPYGSQETTVRFVLNSLARNPTKKDLPGIWDWLIGIGSAEVKAGTSRVGEQSQAAAETF